MIPENISTASPTVKGIAKANRRMAAAMFLRVSIMFLVMNVLMSGGAFGH